MVVVFLLTFIQSWLLIVFLLGELHVSKAFETAQILLSDLKKNAQKKYILPVLCDIREYWLDKTLSFIFVILVVLNIDFGTQNKDHQIYYR